MYMYDYLKKRGLSYTAEIFRKEGYVTTQPPFGIYTTRIRRVPVSNMRLRPTPTHIITLNYVIFLYYYWCRVRVYIPASYIITYYIYAVALPFISLYLIVVIIINFCVFRI